MNVITPKPFAPEAPQPLIREIAKGADYPIDALGPLRAVVEAVGPIGRFLRRTTLRENKRRTLFT